ncbi:MAG: DegT/DnrJ/EryC1/StrS family aminotransferase [Candidatus Omnitrophica bacterium]|nr:DegT/DnrJ/EryC1/StrS family aminotransferase [Candidatus Omnitrophota bacterium]
MKTKIPSVDLQAEFREIHSEVTKRIQAVLAGGRYILGKEVQEFETNFARFTGVKYALGVASGSDALLLGLMAFDVRPGDEVITTSFTFISTATAIARLGAKPVFADIEPNTFNLNPNLIKNKINRRTKGIIVVHLYGHPCRMDEIMRIAKRHRLFVIEDCAQACGATFRGKQVGTFGDMGAFSFYPTKTIGAMGDAGAVIAQSKKLYEKLKSLARHGEDGTFHSYRHVRIGVNSRLDELQAAVLNVKLKHLPRWNRMRRALAKRYDQLLQQGTGLKFDLSPVLVQPTETKAAKSVYHQYTLRVQNRDELRNYLSEQGVASSVYYPLPLHLQPCFRYLRYRKGSLPQAERASREVLSLPLYPQMSLDKQKIIVSALRRFLSWLGLKSEVDNSSKQFILNKL